MGKQQEEKTLGQLLEDLVGLVTGDADVERVDADYHGMKVVAYKMGPGRIRIDLKGVKEGE